MMVGGYGWLVNGWLNDGGLVMVGDGYLLIEVGKRK